MWELEAISDNELLLDDAVTDLMTVNEQTHELLLSGTRNGRGSLSNSDLKAFSRFDEFRQIISGLLKLWDPMFHEHSHEITQPSAKLVTATYLLNDVSRITTTKKTPNETIYRSLTFSLSLSILYRSI